MIRGTVIALVFLLLAGCGGRLGGSGLAGTYQPILIGHEKEKEPVVAQGSELEIRSDGSFLIRGFPKMEGRVQVEGDLITLKIERAGDKAVSELKNADGRPVEVAPILLKQAEGGSRLVPAAANKNPLKFTWLRAKG